MEYIEECKVVIEELHAEFDSHEFIRSFIKKFHVEYGIIIIMSKSVTSAHSKIAKYLKEHRNELRIEILPGKVKSDTIFGKYNYCCKWKKL
ncbi:MAG: hypothetical protein HDS58_03475 [Barnesiella sp.]|nr:hypothetical protein [Barnesiella sp.]MBD5246240.1 hypothetical protein [Barnesiella sp.]MBD5249138.1 hypothetical protein [Barnesiella sp.]